MKQESRNNYESLNPDLSVAKQTKKRFFTKGRIIALSIAAVIVGLCIWDIADPPLWWQSNRQKDKRAILEYAKVQYNGEAKVVSSSFPIINPGLVGPPEDSVMRFKYNDTIFPISAKNGKVINDGYHRARAEDGIEEIMDVGFFQQRNIKANYQYFFPHGAPEGSFEEFDGSVEIIITFKEKNPLENPQDVTWLYDFYLYWTEVSPLNNYSITLSYYTSKNSYYAIKFTEDSVFKDSSEFYSEFRIYVK